jgi:hypothetical protein
MFVLVRSLTGRRGPALVAGAIFALYPYRTEEYAKVQLQLVFWVPLALWAVHRLRAEPRIGRGVLAGIFAALQMYSCVYWGIFAVVPLAFVAAATIAAARPDRRRVVLRALLAGTIVFAVACLPLAVAYRSASHVVGERAPEDIQRWSASPADFRRSPPDNRMYGDPAHPGIGERRLFPGWTALVLSAAAFVPPIGTLSLASAAYAGAGVLSADFALGFNGVGYRTLYVMLPPLRALRVPARFAMFVGLALAVLGGFGVARLSRGRSPIMQVALVVIALMTVTVEGRNRPLDLSELPKGIPPVYAWLADQPRAVVCEYPVGNLQGRAGPQDPTYMYYSTRDWQPRVNGYSGFEPPSYRELLDRLRSFPDDASIAYLRQRGVTLLLVHSAYYLRGNFTDDVSRLRRRSDLEWAGEFPAPNGQFTEVFRLKASASAD